MTFLGTGCSCTEASYHRAVGGYVLNQVKLVNSGHDSLIVNRFLLLARVRRFEWPSPSTEDSFLRF